MGIKNLIFSLRSLSEGEKKKLESLSELIDKEKIDNMNKYLKQKKIKIEEIDIPYSEKITPLKKYIQIKPLDEKIENEVQELNKTIVKKLGEQFIEKFSKKAWELIPQCLSPQIVGFGEIKKAIALQLFSKDPCHILLIGDSGTGKTELVRASEKIAPVSSFGLGSGTSSVGLTVTVKDKEVKKGLLPLADKGIALIDELNLLKKEDRAGLLNSMEKGFITYDKGGEHLKFDARCSILATANPDQGKIKGVTLNDIKKQMPFDPPLLSRFHLVFLIREQNIEEFMQITDGVLGTKQDINSNDLEFIKNYVKRGREIKPKISDEFNDMIKKFVKEVKEQEDTLLIDVTPRFIIGLKRLIEASARLELRDKIQKEDVWKAIEIFSMAIKTINFAVEQ